VLNNNDPRRLKLERWLDEETDLAVERIEPASADASFRRYFRVHAARGSYIVMDAPPEREDCTSFVRIAGYLETIGLSAPRVLAADEAAGFLLLSDLGERQFLDEIRAAPERVDALYGDALAALLALQARGVRFQSQLPPYDETLLRDELALFHDWLCERYLGIRFSRRDERQWQKTCDVLVAAALLQPRVFVHRDFHSRNLMVRDEGNPGILDFQDAVEGPYTYDLVSLLKDCYLELPADKVKSLALTYLQRASAFLPRAPGDDAFLASFELMGVQRHLKAAGIFARLDLRDGKSAYLDDVPRTLGYITALGDRHAGLAFVIDLIATRCLPGMVRS